MCSQKHEKKLFSEGSKAIYNGFSDKFFNNFIVTCVNGGDILVLFRNTYTTGVFSDKLLNII